MLQRFAEFWSTAHEHDQAVWNRFSRHVYSTAVPQPSTEKDKKKVWSGSSDGIKIDTLNTLPTFQLSYF